MGDPPVIAERDPQPFYQTVQKDRHADRGLTEDTRQKSRQRA